MRKCPSQDPVHNIESEKYASSSPFLSFLSSFLILLSLIILMAKRDAHLDKSFHKQAVEFIIYQNSFIEITVTGSFKFFQLIFTLVVVDGKFLQLQYVS